MQRQTILKIYNTRHDTLFSIIPIQILNIIGNQLISLHIDDNCNTHHKQPYPTWEFFTNILQKPYPCTKDIKQFIKKSWFPINLKELCFSSNKNYSFDTCLWHNVNKYTFPNLKSLCIHTNLNESNEQYMFSNNHNNNNNNYFISNLT